MMGKHDGRDSQRECPAASDQSNKLPTTLKEFLEAENLVCDCILLYLPISVFLDSVCVCVCVCVLSLIHI